MRNELAREHGPAIAEVLAGIVEAVSTLFPWVTVPAGDPATARFREDLDLDSLHMVELQATVEDRFAVMFDPEDDELLDAFTTIGALAGYVGRLRGADR